MSYLDNAKVRSLLKYYKNRWVYIDDPLYYNAKFKYRITGIISIELRRWNASFSGATTLNNHTMLVNLSVDVKKLKGDVSISHISNAISYDPQIMDIFTMLNAFSILDSTNCYKLVEIKSVTII